MAPDVLPGMFPNDKLTNGVPCKIHPNIPEQSGYVRIMRGCRRTGAHVFSLEEKLGRRLLPGLLALHDCDIKNCHEPLHLYEGDHKQNALDAVNRGRSAFGDRNGSRVHPESLKPCIGEIHGGSKLREWMVTLIRKLYNSGDWPQEYLAEWFGVSQRTISKIVNHVNWKHIP